MRVLPRWLACLAALLVAWPAFAQSQSRSYFDFNDGLQGWIAGAPAGSGVGWAADGTPAGFGSGAFSPPASLNFNNGNSYDSGGTSRGSVTSPVISLVGWADPVLRFHCNYQTETTGTSYDKRWVRFHYDERASDPQSAPNASVQLRGSLGGTGGPCAAMGTWHFHQIQIPASVTAVRITLEFDSVDNLYNGYSGWFVDDLGVLPKPGMGETVDGPYFNGFNRPTPSGSIYDYSNSDVSNWKGFGPSGTISGYPRWAIDGDWTQVSAPATLNFNRVGPIDYDSGGRSWMQIESPKIHVGGMREPVLRFWCLYETESFAEFRDRRIVRVWGADSGVLKKHLERHLWGTLQCGPTMKTWHTHEIPLDPQWGRISIEFSFDSVDGQANQFLGWFIDDLSVAPRISAPGVFLDVSPPDTWLLSGPPATTSSRTATMSFGASEPGARFVRIFDGAWSEIGPGETLSNLTLGAHRYAVHAVDAVGNIDPTPVVVEWTVVADTTPPETSITAGPADPTAAESVLFSLASSKPGSSFYFRVDDGPWDYNTSGSVTVWAAEGTHVFVAYAVDAAGLADPTVAQWTWTVDTTGPSTIFLETPSAITTETTATFRFEAGESGCTFQVMLDGGPWTPAVSPITLTDLSLGGHVLQVRATDALGNLELPGVTMYWSVVSPPDDVGAEPTPPPVEDPAPVPTDPPPAGDESGGGTVPDPGVPPGGEPPAGEPGPAPGVEIVATHPDQPFAWNNPYTDLYSQLSGAPTLNLALEAGKTYLVETLDPVPDPSRPADQGSVDPVLHLRRATYLYPYFVAQDDDGAGDGRSRLVYTPEATDTYVLHLCAKRPGTYGRCTLRVSVHATETPPFQWTRQPFFWKPGEAPPDGSDTLQMRNAVRLIAGKSYVIETINAKAEGSGYQLPTVPYLGGGFPSTPTDDTRVWLVDETGQAVAENDDRAPGVRTSRIEFTPSADGLYRILLRAAESGKIGRCDVLFHEAGAPYRSTWATDPLPVGTVIREFASPGNGNWVPFAWNPAYATPWEGGTPYAIDLVAGVVTVIETGTFMGGPSTDTIVYVRDPAGEFVASDDDGTQSASYPYASRVAFVPRASGTYTIVVAASVPGSGAYTALRVTTYAEESPAFRLTGQPFSWPWSTAERRTRVAGQFEQGLRLRGGTTYMIRTANAVPDATAGTTDTVLYVEDDAGTLLAEGANGGGGGPSLVEFACPADGLYWVQVRAASQGAGGRCDLIFDRK